LSEPFMLSQFSSLCDEVLSTPITIEFLAD